MRSSTAQNHLSQIVQPLPWDDSKTKIILSDRDVKVGLDILKQLGKLYALRLYIPYGSCADRPTVVAFVLILTRREKSRLWSHDMLR